MSIFEGVCTALITPFKNGKVDYEALERLIEFQIAGGVDAVVSCGTTGEPSTMPIDEHLEVIDFTIKQVKGRIPVIAGTGSNCTSSAIASSKRAQEMGADALLWVTPYYNKCTQKGLYNHYTALADSVDIPAIIYNVPGRTGVNIAPETALKLSEHKNIAALKEASGNFSQVMEVARLLEGKMDIYSGNDDQTMPIMALGGKGVISVASNIIPKEMHDMTHAMLDGNYNLAREMQFKLNPLINALFCEVNPIPVKTAAAAMGLCDFEIRSPLCEMEDKNKEKLISILKEYGLI